MDPIAVRLEGFGRYAPERVIDHEELAESCAVSWCWVDEHTGVRERPRVLAEDGKHRAAMADVAARDGLKAAACRISVDRKRCLLTGNSAGFSNDGWVLT